MKQKIKTSYALAKNIFTTGAFIESSKDVKFDVCRHIDSQNDIIVVEFGMGHGTITKEILNRISKNSKVYSFEVNEEFCTYVGKQINDDRLIIINDSAENVTNHISSNVSAVISSIPFSFLSKESYIKILNDSYNILNTGCYFSQALYTKFNFKKFESVFDRCLMTTIRNFPPEVVYHCLKEK